MEPLILIFGTYTNLGLVAVKNAELISKADENKLWRSGVLGTSTPRSLFNTVFFYNGKNFCLRGEEHRQLHLSQLKRFSDSDHYVYYENCSKNRAGTFRQKRIKWYQYTVLAWKSAKKDATSICSPEATKRCLGTRYLLHASTMCSSQ